MYEIEKRNGQRIINTEIGELIWVRPSTKRGCSFNSSYAYSCCYSLSDAYVRPSEWKQDAWRTCQEYCRDMRGYGLKITGHSCHTFSAAFKCRLEQDDEDEVIIYITKDHLYCVPIVNYD